MPKGWRNESRRHSMASRGIKTAQKVPFVPKMKDQELAKVIRNLDPFVTRLFQQQLANGVPPKKALEVIVNSVEGDRSQLSPELAEYAEKQGWLDSDGDGVPDSKDCQPMNPNRQDREVDEKKGEVIELLPREKTKFGLETGRVKVRFGDGSVDIVPVAMLKADKDFMKLSADEMKKVMSKPYHGIKKGKVVEISEEEYFD